MHQRALTVAVAALLAGSALAAQNTLRVGPGQRFTELQPAIDAAAPGDRIVVAIGTYNAANLQPVVVHKPLNIVADAGDVLGIQRAVVYRGLRCVGIPAGTAVTLANLRIVSGDMPGVRGLTALDVVDCPGTVAVHGCDLFSSGTRDAQGRVLYLADPVVSVARATVVLTSVRCFGGWGSAALSATDAQVFLDQSWTGQSVGSYVIQGEPSFYADAIGVIANGPVGRAAVLVRSFASISGAQVSGAGALPGTWPRGGDAIQMSGGELHLIGCLVRGGPGASGGAAPGGAGGDGLVHAGTVLVDGSTGILGGTGGAGTPPGAAGTAVTGAAPQVAPIPLLSAPRTPSHTTPLSFQTSVPTPFVYWIIGSAAAPGVVPGVHGLLLHDPGFPLYVEGPGTRSQLDLPFFDVPGASLFVQTMAIDPITLAAYFSTPCVAAIRGL